MVANQSLSQSIQGCGCGLMGLGCLLIFAGIAVGGVLMFALAAAG